MAILLSLLPRPVLAHPIRVAFFFSHWVKDAAENAPSTLSMGGCGKIHRVKCLVLSGYLTLIRSLFVVVFQAMIVIKKGPPCPCTRLKPILP